MLERLFQLLLKQYFGQFITGIDNVELALWTGKIQFQNASFKHEKLNELFKQKNIPLSLKYSSIGSLQIDVPWNKLSSAPVEVRIQNILIVLKLEKVTKVEENIQAAKLALIKNYIEYLSSKINQSKEQEKKKEKGYLQKMFIKILNNLNVDIKNISIRIQNSDNLSSEFQKKNSQINESSFKPQKSEKNFSLGFCLKSLNLYPIDENNEKINFTTQDKVDSLKKMLQLEEISAYWEEQSKLSLFRVDYHTKNQMLLSLIDRKENRLLTLNGNIIMEKNCGIFDYFFKTNIDKLDIGCTYEQLKEMVQVYTSFMNASETDKIRKMQELQPIEQEELKVEYKKCFMDLYDCNFQKANGGGKILRLVSKKQLLEWSRQNFIERTKEIKKSEVLKEKNKKSWFSFLASKANIELTEEDIREIEQQIEEIFKDINEKKKTTFAFELSFNQINLEILHKEIKQSLEIMFIQIHFNFQSLDQQVKAKLKFQDLIFFFYNDSANKKTPVIKKKQPNQHFFSLDVEVQPQKRKINLEVAEVLIHHQINILMMIKELTKLKEQEEIQSEVALKKVQAEVNKNIGKQLNKQYEINIKLDKIIFFVEVNENSYLLLSIQKLQLCQRENNHKGMIENFSIAYSQLKEGKSNKNPILKDFTINFEFSNDLNIIDVEMNKLEVVLCEEDLYKIYRCFKKQANIFKIQKREQKNKMLKENSYIEGNLKLLNIFKTWKEYYAILTATSLYFYNIESEEENKKPINVIPLKSSQITIISKDRFRIQSENVNEIIECDQEIIEEWVKKIQQVVFECSSKMEMYNIIEGNVKEENKMEEFNYSTKICMKLKSLVVVMSQNHLKNVLQLNTNNCMLNLQENSLNFKREIIIGEVNLKLCETPFDSDFGYLLHNNELQKHYPIKIKIEGKKKLNPTYQGELNVAIQAERIKLNYDAELVYRLLKKISWGNEAVEYSSQMRNEKVFQFTKNFLQSKFFHHVEEKLGEAKTINEEYSKYIDINEYKNYHSCVALLSLTAKVDKIDLYLINGRTNMCPFNAKISDFKTKIDKGANFFFFRSDVGNLELFDVTGYPQTNSQPWYIENSYPLVRRQGKKKNKSGLVAYFSRFPQLSFINKDRISSFFKLDLFDLELNYQHQPVMRFIDYLTNQLILFLMEPSSLHRFDGPKRGPFSYQNLNLKQSQIKNFIKNCIQPFFNKLLINAYNLAVVFNSFPYQEGINIFVDKVSVESVNSLNNQRIKFKAIELQMMQKYDIFKKLIKIPQFQERIMKNQWVSRLDITAEGCRSSIVENSFNYNMFFERVLHGEKDLLFSFLEIDKTLISKSEILNLSIKAPKKVYNLVNRCFLHNLAYDDGLDSKYQTNYEFKKRVKLSEMFYSVKLNELSIIIPQKDIIVIIPQFEYKFIRYPSQVKEMEVFGKSLHILDKDKSLIIPHGYDEHSGLEFIIEMKTNGDKVMSVVLKSLQITLDIQKFTFLGQYFLLDQSCYPVPKVFNDLPFISCNVCILNTFIKIFSSERHDYVAKGDINILWVRNKLIHPQKYEKNRELFPSGKEWDNFKVVLKGFQLRKYLKDHYEKNKLRNWRSLSGGIELTIKVSRLMKMSVDGEKYNDVIIDYKIYSLLLKLCYKDIQQVKENFAPKGKEEQKKSEIKKSYNPLTKHAFEIAKVSLQFGVSELPVPLVNIELKNTKGFYETIGSNNTLSLTPILYAAYWNMMIGRWEPILQQMVLTLNFKLGREKYIIIDCLEPLLIDLSVQALKVMSLIYKDFQEKGNLAVIEKGQAKVRGGNISPYILTNRTGMNLIVTTGLGNPTKLMEGDKIYLEMKSFDIAKEVLRNVTFQIEGDPNEYEVNLNKSSAQKLKINYQGIDYHLIVKSIVQSMVKEIIISSPYVIENKTSYPLWLICARKTFKVNPSSKTAIDFQTSLRKDMRLQFPTLKNVKQNYQFLYQHLLNGYEHYINYSFNKVFNCVLTLKQEPETTIVAEPAFYVKNMLPVDFYVEFAVLREKDKEKQTYPMRLQVNEEKQLYDFSSKEDPEVRIKLKGFNISSFQKISSKEKDKQYKDFIDMIDHRGHDGRINIKVIREGKVRRIYFYSEVLLINETKYDWYAFIENKLIPGQKLKDVPESYSNYSYISEAKMINFGFDEENPFNSNEVSINQIGLQEVSMFKGTVLYEFTIKNTLQCLDNVANIYSNVLKAEPKFAIVNHTSFILEVAQIQMDSKSIFIHQNERHNWTWPLKAQRKLIILRVKDNQVENRDDEWNFCPPFSLSKMQETVIVLRPKSNKVWKRILKLKPLREHQTTFLIVEECLKPEDYLITIKNDLKLCKLKLFQESMNKRNVQWAENKYFQIQQNETSPFGWDFPNEPHKVVAEVSFHGPLRGKFKKEQIKIDFTSQGIHQYRIHNEDGDVFTVEVNVQIMGFGKCITFKEKDRQNMDDEEEEMQLVHAGNRIGLSISEIGISIINGGSPRFQLCFITIKKLQVIMMDKKTTRTLQLKVKYVNIDNNINHNTVYPILFTPLKFEKTMNKSRPFIVLLMEQNKGKKDIMQIKQLRVCIEPSSIKIHDEVLSAVFEVMKEFQKITNEKVQKIDLVAIYRSYFKKNEWEEIQIVKDKSTFFIQEFQIAELSLEISFSIRPRFNAENFIIMTIISSFGVAISNVSEAKLTMSRFTKKDTTLKELTTELSDYYFKQFFKGIYKVLGSVNLLGNPYVFIKLFAEGTWEIVNQPTEGFIKGPIEGTIGIAKGGIYFTRNVVAGTFNSFQAISESVSRGVSYMTMDEKFIERRQKIKLQKSTHIFKGFQYGLFSLYTGFEVAFTGLVRHPMDGYQKNGFAGGATGTLKGLAGLVTKPISGTFEGISKVSEGIKNTALLFQDGPNSKRARPPRVFFSDQEYYESYSFHKSFAISTLELFSTKYLQNKIYFIDVIQNEEQRSVDALVLTSHYFCYLDLGNRRIINQADLNDITGLDLDENRLKIITEREPIIIREGKYQDLYREFKKNPALDFIMRH